MFKDMQFPKMPFCIRHVADGVHAESVSQVQPSALSASWGFPHRRRWRLMQVSVSVIML